MKTCKRKNGFTLIEMMIAIVSASILAMLVSLILFLGYLSWRTHTASAQLQRDCDHAVDIMAMDIREASFIDIVAFEDYLILPTNAVRADSTEYQKIGDTLVRYVNETENGLPIPKGLTRFNPQVQSNGVLLQLELTDSQEGQTITNRSFIETRN